MKFAHEFKESLSREGYPSHWLEAAVPYSQLKKCLKKAQEELQGLGLDRETLQQLLAAQAASYKLDSGKSQPLRPRLFISVQLQDGVLVDAALSSESRDFLHKLSATRSSGTASPGTASPEHADHDDEQDLSSSPDEGDNKSLDGRTERIEVPLVFDGEFFNILKTDVTSLDALQEEEQKSMETDIVALGQEISSVTRPSKFAKSDINRWREIFELYLDAQIFFSSHERDHGSRSSAKALQQLVWFQSEMQKRDIMKKFKVPASLDAYSRFLRLNATLLQHLKFQEINKLAIRKILKSELAPTRFVSLWNLLADKTTEFDKRTCLGASMSFRAAVHSQKFIAENVAKEMCAQVSQEVISIVPRVEDYTCPVCLTIAWLPVRLKCSHIYCVRCVIKMQRENKKQCPLCRGEVVMDADLCES